MTTLNTQQKAALYKIVLWQRTYIEAKDPEEQRVALNEINKLMNYFGTSLNEASDCWYTVGHTTPNRVRVSW